MTNYNHKKIEKKWQAYWEKKGFYRAKDFDKKIKKYILIEFPYSSGDGLHVGHVRSYSALDAVARKKRMEGYNVLYPIGWDAFGLPTENYAIKKGIHPAVITRERIKMFKRQLKSLGLSFDWSREVNTADPNYYKWTQWIFLQFFKNGLAYQAEMPINWCPKCKIGLANEEVIAGKCERCGAETEKRNIKQWLLKITKYADRLIDDLDKVDYLEKIKTQQKNWIGRSEGVTIKFSILRTSDVLRIEVFTFTTRADTLFGATALVVAPEHQIISNLKSSPYGGSPAGRQISNLKEVEDYIRKAAKRSEMERLSEEKEKTGVKLEGICAINPVNNEKIPVWVGDYVVATYGGGAVMVVPAHDKRDFEFAKRHNLPIKQVVAPISGTSDVPGTSDVQKIEEAFTEDGVLVNSGQFDGLTSEKAREEITRWLEEKGKGKRTIQYKLRDWIFSRQHYWGEPIPLIFCENCKKLTETSNLPPTGDLPQGDKSQISKLKKFNFNKGELLNPGWIAVPEKDLPIELPYVKKYKPTKTGKSPLAAIVKWGNTKCPKCKGPAQRETDTMPNWAGSSWYYLAYLMRGISNFQFPISKYKKVFKYWLPVDLYNGGMEHTTLHLLYSRFWHKFLYDLKLAPTTEPYQARRSHGMVLAEDGRKMSKSFGNVINPDEIIKNFGADTLRIYEMFMGPFDQAINWSNRGVVGIHRFLNRIWQLQRRVFVKGGPASGGKNPRTCRECEIILHKSIKKISEDLENMKFNTAISQLMILVNELEKEPIIDIDIYKTLLKLLAPFAPHLSEELWYKLYNEMRSRGRTARSHLVINSVHLEEWPKYDKNKVKEETFELVIQINGKVRDRVSASVDISEGEAKELALSQERIQKFLAGKTPPKIIFIPGRLINIVV